METNIAVVEWSPDGARAFNPVTRQTASGATVKDALTKVGSPQVVGLCLSRRVSFVRGTHLPPAAKSELRLIVNVQLENLFPAVKSELAFDFDIGTHRFDDGVQAMVCAVQADSLRTALKEVESAGAKVHWVAPTAYASAFVASTQGHDDAIVVEESDGYLNLDVVRHGMLVYSRSVIDGKSQNERQAEVSRTLAGYGLPAAAVIAIGDTDLGDDVRQSQEAPLHAMARHAPAAINVELPEAVARKFKRASDTRSRLAVVLWLAVASLAAFIFIGRSDEAKAMEATRMKATSAVSSLEKDIDLVSGRLTSTVGSVKVLKTSFHPAQSVSDVLTVVSNTLPSGAWLTGVTFDRGKPIQIRGTALTGESVTAFTTALAIESRFRDVQLTFANNSEIENTPVVQFAVTAHVVGNLPLIEEKQGARARK